jgi:hypothetical protein
MERLWEGRQRDSYSAIRDEEEREKRAAEKS